MQAIASKVYIEDQYPGVTLGAIALPHGLIQIDAPPSPEDSRSWRAALLSLNTGVERVLVNLDSHPDRTLGARAMDCMVIAHEKTAQAFRNRPNTFKAQGDETGAAWENVAGLGSVRWFPPEITFTARMVIEWSNLPIILESHPGPASGAIWAILPDEKVVFVGDLVLRNQPPFLANANFPAWIESLETLLTPQFQNYAIVSGRGGVVAESTIRAQLNLMKDIHEKLEALAQKQAGAAATDALIQPILNTIHSPSERNKQFIQRLSYGLHHYYVRHYQPSGAGDEEEE
jgi:glyoxylase-like metal-dependent hydrolase (beta-lactamase superfamily II)